MGLLEVAVEEGVEVGHIEGTAGQVLAVVVDLAVAGVEPFEHGYCLDRMVEVGLTGLRGPFASKG
jgi:hypothetical protein